MVMVMVMVMMIMMMVMIVEIRESEDGEMWTELRILISNDDDIMIMPMVRDGEGKDTRLRDEPWVVRGEAAKYAGPKGARESVMPPLRCQPPDGSPTGLTRLAAPGEPP